MPSFEQLKAYLQNPDVALQELKSRAAGMGTDADMAKQDFAQQSSDQLNALVPGTTTPENRMANLEAAESLSNVAGVVGKGPSLAARIAASRAAGGGSGFGKVFQAGAPVAEDFGKVIMKEAPTEKLGKVIMKEDPFEKLGKVIRK